MNRLVLAVADRFHKLPHEIEELPPAEFSRCLAYINVTNREQRKAQEDARHKRGSGKSGGGKGPKTVSI